MIIKIKNLAVDVFLGAYDSEREKLQKVLVNLEVNFNEGISFKTDNVSDTLDYAPICEGVRHILKSQPYNLIETMVERVGKKIISYEAVESVIVEIDKPEVPIDNVESISILKFFKG